MNPKLCKRLILSEPLKCSAGTNDFIEKRLQSCLAKTSVQDQAALLLSIADIAKSEMSARGFLPLWSNGEDLPQFPVLSGSSNDVLEKTNDGSLPASSQTCSGDVIYAPSRIRSVSMDSPDSPTPEIPLSHSLEEEETSNFVTPLPSPRSVRLLTRRKASPRLSARAKRELSQHHSSDSDDSSAQTGDEASNHRQPDPPSCSNTTRNNNKPLQKECPEGVPIKRIARRKFSWKSYPELEHFLIVNREEYLRHSALNYTVQQKQYNNRLTERLLELASENGYLFDEDDFVFVTVRDRIRCYYKSYVQSAKKRGILMGYAARKAGLLSEECLELDT